MGGSKLTSPTPYPPSITPGFMGVKPPPGNINSVAYFQNYRDETLSRQRSDGTSSPIDIIYTPKVDIGLLNKRSNLDKFIRMPQSQFTMLDVGRQQEIDNFYMACQMYRDQYKDHVGRLHPLDYFKNYEYTFQCSSDPTTKYLKCPLTYVKYKSPQVFPLTLERSYRSPMLPDRALTGRYNPSSDITFKR